MKRRPLRTDGVDGSEEPLPEQYRSHLPCAFRDCPLPAEHVFSASTNLCDAHYCAAVEPLRLISVRRQFGIPKDYPLGVAVFSHPHADYPLRFGTDRIGNVYCSVPSCGATWVGIQCDVCLWCLRRWERVKETR